jgi:hypothetical protein
MKLCENPGLNRDNTECAAFWLNRTAEIVRSFRQLSDDQNNAFREFLTDVTA